MKAREVLDKGKQWMQALPLHCTSRRLEDVTSHTVHCSWFAWIPLHRSAHVAETPLAQKSQHDGVVVSDDGNCREDR